MSIFKAMRNASTEKQPAWVQNIDTSEANISLDHSQEHTQIKAQLSMINLTETDLRLLKAYQPIVSENINEVVEKFYSKIVEHSRLKLLINQNSTIDRLRITLRQHLIEVFSGQIDANYIEKRIKIANVHAQIGLEPQWYIAAFQNLQYTLISMIQAEKIPAQLATNLSFAVTKILNFEQQLVLEAYDRINREEQERQYDIVKNELKQQIGTISQELAALTEQASASSEQLLTSSTEVNRAFFTSADKARLSQELVVSGEQKVQELDEGMQAIRDGSMTMQQLIERMYDSVEEINDIVSIVEQISSQTKLLSLNASIEAAHAGEHGAGFSIVAAEVKKLAEDTNHAVTQIRELIDQTNSYANQVVHGIKEVQRRVVVGHEEVHSTKTVFLNISSALNDSLKEIEQVETGITSLVRVIEDMGSSTDKVATMANELNDSTESL